jgi:hypothetical protein
METMRSSAIYNTIRLELSPQRQMLETSEECFNQSSLSSREEEALNAETDA